MHIMDQKLFDSFRLPKISDREKLYRMNKYLTLLGLLGKPVKMYHKTNNIQDNI